MRLKCFSSGRSNLDAFSRSLQERRGIDHH
uniref:Uncharacterized protein n=1 Tax=Anguilla anguilla TaxID=7936 RepID=A0A0E9VQN3_ANGAN